MMKTLNLNLNPNNCCVAMWHIINGMMKTQNPNPNPNNCCATMWHTINSMMKTLKPNPNTCKMRPLIYMVIQTLKILVAFVITLCGH